MHIIYVMLTFIDFNLFVLTFNRYHKRARALSTIAKWRVLHKEATFSQRLTLTCNFGLYFHQGTSWLAHGCHRLQTSYLAEMWQQVSLVAAGAN